LKDEYECWLIDKFEGMGNGPKRGHANLYHIVYDYMGNFNQDLPDDYFDLVFSISALEHVPQDDVRVFDYICQDINRVLKKGRFSLHCFDIVYINNKVRVFSKFIYFIVTSIKIFFEFTDPNRAAQELEMYFMSRLAYEKIWYKTTKIPYLQFGSPTSINILWRRNE
jgi:ubiquinone/menaquinone biosynthesis C-methylase UbiE